MISVRTALKDEVANVSLPIKGNIPGWLSGTLIRNGPITVTIDGKSNEHWFDGLGMLHGFSFHSGEVRYSNRFLRTDAYKAVFDENSLRFDGFAVDPCRSIFRRYFSLFWPSQSHVLHNANINVAKFDDAYVALFEIPLPVKFDLQTLQTLGLFQFQDSLPVNNCWESAHPHHDVHKRETINYIVKFGAKNEYIFHRMYDGSAQREIISTIPVEEPSYMHSFAVTENYLILTAFPYVLKPLDLILKGIPFIKNYRWEPERGTNFIIVDRNNGQLVGQYSTKSFFAFHHVNAFEEDGKLHLDIICYDDASIVTGKLFDQNIPEANKNVDYPNRLERFTFCNGIIRSEKLFAITSELPRINERHDGKPYRYTYLVGFADREGERATTLQSKAIFKFDTASRQHITWSEKGCSPGEAVFVSTPGVKGEDDGVIMSVVFDEKDNSSFLLILDAKDLKELARAVAPHAIPLGLHGQFFGISGSGL